MKTALLVYIFLLAGTLYGQDTISPMDSTVRLKEIGDVFVSAKSKKEIAYKDSRYYIMDFHIDSNGTFLLLNRFSMYFVYLLNSDMEPIVKKNVSFHPKKLFSDCTGELHVLSKDSMYRIEKSGDSLQFSERRSIDRYTYYFRDCVGSNDLGLIFKSVKNHQQTTDFYQIEYVSRFTQDVYVIEDSSLIRSARETTEELRKEEARLRRKYSRDVNQRAPTWEDRTQEGHPQIDRSTEIKRYMDRRQFYGHFAIRPYYNPLFVRDDTTFIFDHVNGEMVRLNRNREVLWKDSINYHNESRWKGEMQLDQKRDIFYSVEERHGAQIYGRLSTKSGNIIRKTKITRHAYPEKVIVYNGYAYYAYRQSFEDNLDKLFRQKL